MADPEIDDKFQLDSLDYFDRSLMLSRNLSGSMFSFVCITFIIEPRREKTGLRGFRQGPTQDVLYDHKKMLVA